MDYSIGRNALTGLGYIHTSSKGIIFVYRNYSRNALTGLGYIHTAKLAREKAAAEKVVMP